MASWAGSVVIRSGVMIAAFEFPHRRFAAFHFWKWWCGNCLRWAAFTTSQQRIHVRNRFMCNWCCYLNAWMYLLIYFHYAMTIGLRHFYRMSKATVKVLSMLGVGFRAEKWWWSHFSVIVVRLLIYDAGVYFVMTPVGFLCLSIIIHYHLQDATSFDINNL